MKTKPFSVAPHLFISKCGASRGRCHFVCLKMPQPAGLACGGTDATVADECHGAGSGRHCAGGGSFFFKIRWVDHPYCSTSSSRLRTHINSVEFSSPQKTEPCFTFHLFLCAESFRHWWLSIQGIRKSLHIICLLKPPTNEGPKQRPQ